MHNLKKNNGVQPTIPLEKKEQIEKFHQELIIRKVFIKGNRNTIKLFLLDNLTLNVKSFKEFN
jgi:hypothetical protein